MRDHFLDKQSGWDDEHSHMKKYLRSDENLWFQARVPFAA